MIQEYDSVEATDLSVLLVDDDPHVHGIFELVMNHHRLPLAVARNAEEALNYLHTHAPDVVVLDIFLPGLDGYQALNRIRESALNPNCRVVATTAYYTNDTQQEILRRGFDGFLAKPFDTKNLVNYLLAVVNRS